VHTSATYIVHQCNGDSSFMLLKAVIFYTSGAANDSLARSLVRDSAWNSSILHTLCDSFDFNG